MLQIKNVAIKNEEKDKDGDEENEENYGDEFTTKDV